MKSFSSPSLRGLLDHRVEDHEELLTLSLSTTIPMSSTIPPLQDLVNSPIASKLQPTSLSLFSPPTFPMSMALIPPSNVCSVPIDLPIPIPISQADGTGSGSGSRASSSSSSSHPPPRRRKSPTQTIRSGKSEIVPAPYPWATTQRATVHSLKYLLSNGIGTINGEVQCRRCDRRYEIEYNLQEKFTKLATFISENKNRMHDRAPPVWMNPILPGCQFCEQSNCVKPILSKKREINWLFLLLGEMLGCCKLAELKYFCKHTRNHRTGAKDRVLYLTYLGLCKQLDPDGPFVR